MKVLKVLQEEIHQRLLQKVEREFGVHTELKEACIYALSGAGKRVRPIIVLLVAKALGNNYDLWDVALGVEFFHTASLIADDLPCMDNDDQRRERPSLHKAFPEAVALLSSYALIAAGYRTLWQTQEVLAKEMPRERSCVIAQLALENATHNTGILGATGGQYLDLFSKDLTQDRLMEIFHGKTATFFEIAFVLGWLFGGGDVALLPRVKLLALNWGLAFQIADDLDDWGQKEGMNLVDHLGEKRAKELLVEKTNEARELLKELKLNTEELQDLLKILVRRDA